MTPPDDDPDVGPDVDEELMRRFCAGETSAYDQLYARWAGRVLNFLIRRTGSRSLAEDALQETWLRVYRHRRRFEPGRRFSPWLFTIAAHAGHDARRPEPEGLLYDGPHQERPELRDQLVRALHRLEPGERRLLLLSVEGFSSQEIAEMEHSTAGAVRMKISRARSFLREVLK